MTDPHPLQDARLIATLERAFAHHAGKDGVIDLADLQRALGIRDPQLARRVLQGFDLNADGVIQKDEFLAGVRKLIFGTDREKLWFAFRLHDRNDDGALDQDEVLRMIAVSLAESDVTARASQPPEQLARALFLAADGNRDGKISFDELVAVVSKRPTLLRKMTRSEAIWIAPNEELLAWIDEKRTQPGRLANWLEDHGLAAFLISVWVVANVAVFGVAMLATAEAPIAMQIGRSLGKCIDFDGALILVPMMRRMLTWVRTTWIGRLVPVDDAITFHRIVGHALFALAVTHTAAIVAAYAAGHSSLPIFRVLESQRGMTGAILLLVFAVMWAFSLAVVRRSQHFELFYFTHLLYVVWLVLAIVHAPTFLWLGGLPIVGFLVEQLLRLRRRGKKANAVSSQTLRSGVTRLELERPPGFVPGPGDYVFLRIPAVARHEWHPFTMSSAPERDALVFHIRSVGNWTAALRSLVEQKPDAEGLVAFVDGPYGSPSAPIFESRFAVLIGAGIGVTPFASVLESIVLRAYGGDQRPAALKKVHFFWLNKDAFSFEWFADLLREIEKDDVRALLDIHLCMTAARSGLATLGLEVAREVMHASGRSDVMTGLRTKTHFGQPDWDTMLGKIAEAHKGQRVDVYYCGPSGLAQKLKPICVRLGMSFREEKF